MTAFDDRGVLQTTVELKYDGEWHDITKDVNAADDIVITRGRSDEASQVDTSVCTFRLDNTNGKYSPRNPNSPLFKKIGRNTPVRVRVPSSAQAGLALPGLDGLYARTPDAPALNISGDIDIRILIDPRTWRPSGNVVFAAKCMHFEPMSWIFQIFSNGRLGLVWSPDSTVDGRISIDSTAPVPENSGRLAVRAILDVDNGSGQSVLTFYTAPSMVGPWTQLGDPRIRAGITSIGASPASLSIAATDNGEPEFTGSDKFAGLVESFELRDGIDGTLVANPLFNADIDGPQFTDEVGLPWTIEGGASVVAPGVRFLGSISAWPSRWDTPDYASVPIEANGTLRRLGQGQSLRSAMVRGLTGASFPEPKAYWPCEGGKDSTTIGSEVPGGRTMLVDGPVKMASYSDFDASDAIPSIGKGLMFGTLLDYPPTNFLRVMALVHVPDSGTPTTTRLMRLVTTGNLPEWWLEINPTGGLQLSARSRTELGLPVLESGFVAFNMNGSKRAIGIYLVQNGANIDWQIFSFDPDTGSAVSFGGTSVNRTFGVARNVTIGGIDDLGDTAVGHVVVLDNDHFFDMLKFIRAWTPETTHERINRLAVEEQITFVSSLTADGTEIVGAQRINGFVDLVQEAADADEGILYEPRNMDGIALRTRASMYDQPAKLTLDYAAGHIGDQFEPTDDDQNVRNDVTAARTEGSSARSVEELGPMSVLEPPYGVGRYTDTTTLNVGSDDQLPDHAGWRRHLGTVDEFRFPKVHVSLNGNPGLVEDALSVDIGDRITINNLPSWMPPGQVEQLVQGYTETLNTFTWDIVFNCSPASPWNTAHVEDTTFGRVDTILSETAHDVTDSATSVDVVTKMGDALWTTKPTEFPFDVDAAGETLTVTSVSSVARDTFTRTTSNGWGTADTGQSWSTVGGTASMFFTDGSQAKISAGSVNTPLGGTVPLDSVDMDVTVTFTVPSVATGTNGWIVNGILARYVNPLTNYNARAEFKESGSWGISIYRGVGAGEAFLNGSQLGTYTAGSKWKLRFKVIDSRLQTKLWAAANPEPYSWQLDVTDTALTGRGDVGVFTKLNTGNTNTKPVVIPFDDFEVTNPQRFTVTRSVNGIVKALPWRSNVRILNPAILAL